MQENQHFLAAQWCLAQTKQNIKIIHQGGRKKFTQDDRRNKIIDGRHQASPFKDATRKWKTSILDEGTDT